MNLNSYAAEFLSTSTEKGFTAGNLSIQDTMEKILLSIGELSEAVEELRAGRGVTEIYFDPKKADKPEGFPIELADAVIRILQLAGALGIDMDRAVNIKNSYNKSRPYKHGKAF